MTGPAEVWCDLTGASKSSTEETLHKFLSRGTCRGGFGLVYDRSFKDLKAFARPEGPSLTDLRRADSRLKDRDEKLG